MHLKKRDFSVRRGEKRRNTGYVFRAFSTKHDGKRSFFRLPDPYLACPKDAVPLWSFLFAVALPTEPTAYYVLTALQSLRHGFAVPPPFTQGRLWCVAKFLHRTIHPAGMYRSAPFHSERILQHPYKLECFNQKNMKKSSIRTEKRPKKFRLLRAYSILSCEHPPFSAGIFGQIYDYFS